MELMEHQKEAIKNLGNGKILWGGVGTGKTATVLGYYVEKETPKDIYVITTAKKRDSLEWEGEAAKFGIGTVSDATLHGVIKIDSWNNIRNYIGVEDAFFVFDEQRVVGSGAWVKAFYKITKRNNWVLLSATPGDTWIDYIPVFVANGLYRNATQFTREHVVYAPYSRFPKIVRYTGLHTLEKYRNMLLVEMPYLSHTHRNVIDIDVQYDRDLFRKAAIERWNPYKDQPLKDVAELFRVMRKIVNSDPSRLKELGSILDAHPKVVLYYNFDYELEILRNWASTNNTPWSEWNGHKHQPIPQTDRWLYLVQYVAGAEGWNCIETDAMVFYSLTYSYKNFMQAQGRIDRLNTPFTELYYYVFVTDSIIDRAVRKSLDSKHLFNERDWAYKNLGIRGEFESVEKS